MQAAEGGDDQSTSSTQQHDDGSGSRNDNGDKKHLFEIDFIGEDTYRVSQNYILQKRSLEPIIDKDSLAALSARGLYHRDKDFFSKELTNSSQLIRSLSKQGMAKKNGSHQLYTHFFNRALAYERLHQTEKAIDDYSTAIKNGVSESQAYFNRAGLYQTQGEYKLALKDFNKAVLLEPLNTDYRYGRALLHRRMGDYSKAIQDTIMKRAIEITPATLKDLENVTFRSTKELQEREKALNIDTNIIGAFRKTVDPILTSLKKPPSSPNAKIGNGGNDALPSSKQSRTPTSSKLPSVAPVGISPVHQTGKKDADGVYRVTSLDPIVDFMKELKFFSLFLNDPDTLYSLAAKFELHSFNKGAYIFHEGDKGNHFFIVLDGEVSIVKSQDGFKQTVLVKLYRGHNFGETALESKGGLRTAGAMASQSCNLMALRADDYQRIMASFHSSLKEEVREVVASCPVFKDWSLQMIEHLSSLGQTKRYSAGSSIMKDGEKIKHLYIIRHGVVQICKKIEKPSMTYSASQTFTNPDSEYEKESPGNWVLETNWKKRLGAYGDREVKRESMQFVTAIMGSGQVFGELAILDPDIHNPTSAIAYTNVELYSFESSVLLTLGSRYNAQTMNSLNESMNLANPPAEKLAFYFRSKMRWEQSKDKLLKKNKQDRELIKKVRELQNT